MKDFTENTEEVALCKIAALAHSKADHTDDLRQFEDFSALERADGI